MTTMLHRYAALALLLTPALMLVGCSSAEKRTLLSEIDAYYADLSARDWDAFADHFWPGATITTTWSEDPNEPPVVQTVTVDEFIEHAHEGPGSQPIFEETRTGAFIILERDLAQVWATYDAKFGTEENLNTWSGIDAFTLLRHDGRWRITAIAFQPD